MSKMIAYCGLDCEKCEARIATLNNDDNLRAKVAKEWSEMNNFEITPEMINCEGCRVDGIKTYFCEKMCEIKKCASVKPIENCGGCAEMDNCEKLKMIIDYSAEARENLKK